MDLKKLTYAELTVIREDLLYLVNKYHVSPYEDSELPHESYTSLIKENKYWESRLKKVREEMTKRLKSINNN